MFARIWVRKEALVKTGELALDDLSGIDMAELPAGWRDYRILEWEDVERGVVGAAVARDLPVLVTP